MHKYNNSGGLKKLLKSINQGPTEMSINSSHIVNGSILGTDLSNNTITSGKIADLNVTEAKIANLNVTEGKIGPLAVTEGKIGALAVTEGKIGGLAVTSSKIGPKAVGTGKIDDLAVTEAKIDDLAVTNNKIGSQAVTNPKIAEATIGFTKFTTNCINNLQTTPPNSIDASHIKDGTLTETKLTTLAITSLKTTPANSINSSHIIDGTILGTDIAINQIGVNHLTGAAYLDLVTSQAENSINTGNIVNGAIVNDHIYPLTITDAKIANGTITEVKLSTAVQTKLNAVGSIGANSINSSHIINGSILGSDISDNTITGSNIANTTITYDKLNSNITSLITNSNISRNYIFQTGTQSNVTIPVDLVNNEFVDVHVTFRFVTSFAPNNRLWCLFYNASSLIYNFKWYDGEFIVNQTANPWLRQYFGQNSYNGMFAYDMDASNYSRATNLRIRVYRGDINTPVTEPRLYNVEGECQWGFTGYGPARATITGAIEYRPTHIYLYVPTGCTFIAKYYVTNYK